MNRKVLNSFIAMEESMETHRKAVTDVLTTVATGKVPDFLNRDDLVRVRADKIPTQIPLTSEKRRMFIVLQGTWVFVNGKFTRELEAMEKLEIPADTHAHAYTNVLGAECCYFER